jgi:tetratricopeptide (TPR) repeat protein
MRVFLSAVSGQFRDLRQALASDLRAMGAAEVKVQEDFTQHGGTLLEKLEAYIAGCDRVIALVGDAYGFEPPEEARPPGRPRRSYTQWEYHFARGERLDGSTAQPKDLFVYLATEPYLQERRTDQSPEQAGLQKQFVAGILASGKDRNPFGSLDELCRLALRDGIRVSNPDHKPVHLPFSTLGPLFKGRDTFLADLRRRFAGPSNQAQAIVTPRAVHGLGGVGKTRAAIEYAWRFRADYRAVLFVSAPSPSEMHARLADLVGVLPIDTAETAVDARLNAVLHWLDDHPGWLLILDNIDTEELARNAEQLLARLTGGHVLITSRIANWGAAVEPLDLHLLDEADAVAFLLERTRQRRRKPDDATVAATIARELGGLALALEQAGAYIDTQRLSLAEYLDRWKAKRAEVLRWHNERLMGYPASVAATWETSFAQLDPAQQQLILVLSWLAPEPIPLAFFEAGPLRAAITDPRGALASLAGYSLARFSTEGDSVEVHRLVQEITRGRAAEAERDTTLTAALDALDDLTPSQSWDVRTWDVWTPSASHVQSATQHADGFGITNSTARLLNGLGLYRMARGQFQAAEPPLRRALEIGERSYGPDHPIVAICLNNLATLLRATGRHAEAEPPLRRALEIDRRALGPDHPDVARDLSNLAQLLQATGRLAEAEPPLRRALEIDRRALGPDHPDVARDLSNHHPTVARDLSNLAQLLYATGRHAEAEPPLRRALEIDRRALGPDHPTVARDLSNLAQLLYATGRHAEAEPPLRRAVTILAEYKQRNGHEHPNDRVVRANYNDLLKSLGEAQPPSQGNVE